MDPLAHIHHSFQKRFDFLLLSRIKTSDLCDFSLFIGLILFMDLKSNYLFEFNHWSQVSTALQSYLLSART